MSEQNTSYVLTLSPEDADDSASSDASIQLEQRTVQGDESYDECYNRMVGIRTDDDGNVISRSDVTMDKVYNAIQHCNEIYCNQDSTFNLEVLVIKSSPDIEYKPVLSHGTLLEMYRDEPEYTDSVDVTLDDYLELDIVPLENTIPSVSWDGDVLSKEGNVIPPPELIYNAITNRIEWSEKVVGTLRVQANHSVDVWPVRITPRDDTDDSKAFSSTFRVFYNDEVETISLTEPTTEGKCGEFAISGDLWYPGDGETCQKKTVVIDGCTGAILRTTTTNIPCQS